MRYTQGQIREVLGLSVETLRAWRRAIPFLVDRKGHSPTFTAGDLVAFAAIAQLVGKFGVRISSISAQAQAIFELCHGQPWLALEDCSIILDERSARVMRVAAQRLGAEPIWIVPCNALIADLRHSLTATELAEQGRLQFPPVALGERR